MPEFTKYLKLMQCGTPGAEQRLYEEVYDMLRKLAANRLAKEGSHVTLNPTELVSEAWLRLGGSETSVWQNRRHFVSAAAEAMRRTLIDHARRKQAKKRGAGLLQRRSLEHYLPVAAEPNDDLLRLNDALCRLEMIDVRRAEVVKLKFFCGMTMNEIAGTMEVSVATVERHWAFCRAWLHQQMQADDTTLAIARGE